MIDLQVKWFAYAAVRDGILKGADCRRLAEKLGHEIDVLKFAEAALQDGLCSDFQRVQQLVYWADTHAKTDSLPPLDIFNVKEDAPTSAEPILPKARDLTEVDDSYIESRGKTLDEISFAVTLAGIETMNDEEVKAGFLEFLSDVRDCGASDLHLCVNERVFIRLHRTLKRLDSECISDDVHTQLVRAIVDYEKWEEFRRTGDLEFPVVLPDNTRLRACMISHRDGVETTFRFIPDKLRSLAQLGYSDDGAVRRLLQHSNGLVLIAGPTGSGKTTTLATLVDIVNQEREAHIITVEDPIEYKHTSKRCVVTQRQVGRDTESFETALRGALREDPDVIVIGDLRGLETIRLAVTAAETGHLVIGTIQTKDAASAIGRLVRVFPASQQAQVRAMAAESLRGVICQQLVPESGARGLVLATEILVNTIAVASTIREDNLYRLTSIMETGGAMGMRTMALSILALYKDKKINLKTAKAHLPPDLHDRLEP